MNSIPPQIVSLTDISWLRSTWYTDILNNTVSRMTSSCHWHRAVWDVCWAMVAGSQGHSRGQQGRCGLMAGPEVWVLAWNDSRRWGVCLIRGPGPTAVGCGGEGRGGQQCWDRHRGGQWHPQPVSPVTSLSPSAGKGIRMCNDGVSSSVR